LSAAAAVLVAPLIAGLLMVTGRDLDEVAVLLIPLAPLVTGIVAVVVAGASRGKVRDLLGGSRFRSRHLVAAAAVGVAAFVLFNIVFGALVVFVLDLLGTAPPEVQQSLRDAAGRPEALPVLVFSTVVVAPIGEELLYRGLIFQSFLRRFGRAGAVWLSALAFAIGHVTIGAALMSNLVLAILIFPLGAVLAWAFLRWGTLWVPVVIHAVFNGITVFFMTAGAV
jgi:uncharacterized protein